MREVGKSRVDDCGFYVPLWMRIREDTNVIKLEYQGSLRGQGRELIFQSLPESRRGPI